MFKSMIAAAMLAGAAVPAAATTIYDAFTSFNGATSVGGFTYGRYDGSNFTAITGANGCNGNIGGTTCIGDLPGIYKSNDSGHNYGTVIVPGDALVLHPGPNAGEAAAIVFTVPTIGNYALDLSAFVADNNPSGVNIQLFVPGFQNGYATLATLTRDNPTFSFSGPLFGMLPGGALPAGFQFGVAVDYDGVYYDDSTGIKFTVTQADAAGAVPETATWGMMVLGFGLVGGAVRRRSATLAAA